MDEMHDLREAMSPKTVLLGLISTKWPVVNHGNKKTIVSRRRSLLISSSICVSIFILFLLFLFLLSGRLSWLIITVICGIGGVMLIGARVYFCPKIVIDTSCNTMTVVINRIKGRYEITLDTKGLSMNLEKSVAHDKGKSTF